jgi:hypothetical protein
LRKRRTAITQSQWTPRAEISDTYSRDQLDAAFQAMLAEGRNAVAQRQSAYAAAQAPAGASTNFTA